jgi:beta-lactamase regulating signal transducer with metallopeptidase domain
VVEAPILIVAWAITYLVHSTILFSIVACLERTRLLRAVAAREYLWKLVLIGALVSATVHVTGGLSLGPAWSRFADAVPAAPGHATDSGTSLSGWVTGSAAGAAIRGAMTDGSRWILLLLLLGVVVALVRVAGAAWLAHRELAGRISASRLQVLQMARLARERRVPMPRLTVADAIPGPVALVTAEIVLPVWAEELEPEQQDALFAHELGHLQRGDAYWALGAWLLASLLWFQPLQHLARRRLRELAELQADAWAARDENESVALAECLLFCAERVQAHRSAAFGAAMSAGGPLWDRVDRLLAGASSRAREVPLLVRSACVVLVLSAIALLPGISPDPLGAEIHNDSARTSISCSTGGRVAIECKRRGYAMRMRTTGEAGFRADRTDLESLAPRCRFELTERLAGVTRTYRIKSDAFGQLAREFEQSGRSRAIGAAEQAWIHEALERMYAIRDVERVLNSTATTGS